MVVEVSAGWRGNGQADERSGAMAEEPVLIKRYPNRRYYAREASRYVSLGEIAEMVCQGRTVEIRDSQTGEDLTRGVLAQILIERFPEKANLFPSAMLHWMLRANDVMRQFLAGYFRDAILYLEYLQRHEGTAPMAQPMHWLKPWFDHLAAQQRSALSPQSDGAANPPLEKWAAAPSSGKVSTGDEHPRVDDAELRAKLSRRIEQLEARLAQLEAERGPASR
jgi:polyhydroxyalkanoate synthesis repressor PhaR